MAEMNALRGKRFISLVRCSTKEQVDTSVGDQIALLEDFAKRNEMTKVDEVRVEGVSASVPARRKELRPLLERADHGDYDVLLVHDLSRFTRSKVRHAYKLECEFEQRGVTVISATDNIPDGPAGEIYKTFKYQANEEYVRRLVHDSARTTDQLIRKGILPHCQKPPYGVDRLYISRDGKPRYRIRNLTNGHQQRLEPDRDVVLEEYPVNDGNCRRHHVKQGDDKVILVKGAPEQVEIVRHIFRRYYVDGWGCTRIALELTARGVPKQHGGAKWGEISVYSIILNPTYTGVGIANRRSKAVYFRRAESKPTPTNLDPKVLMERENPPTIERPRDQWVLVPHPQLADFLERDICEEARAHQFEVLQRKSLKIRAHAERDKHVDSSFFLKGLLRSLQGDEPMSGKVSTPRKKTYRYYLLWKGEHAEHHGEGMNTHIPAEPVEQAVLNVIREVLSDLKGLRNKVVEMVRDRIAQAAGHRLNTADLKSELQVIDEKLAFIVEEVGGGGGDALRLKARQLQARRAEVERHLREGALALPPSDEDAEKTADAVVAQIRTLSEGMAQGCLTSIRKLVKLLFSKLAVDLKTRTVHMDLRLPSWVALDSVGLDHALACETTPEANAENDRILARFECLYKMKYENRCFNCHRKAA